MLIAAGGVLCGLGQGTREALMGQFGARAGGDVLHRGGWVERPVRLYRDEWGIPHVRARSVHDVFVGQGYVHAMDRLWQMDAARKQMEGRWAEWVGVAGLRLSAQSSGSGRVRAGGKRAGALAGLALHSGHAAARLPYGLSVVQALARCGAWRRGR